MTYFLREEDLTVKVVLLLWKFAHINREPVQNDVASIVVCHVVQDAGIQ